MSKPQRILPLYVTLTLAACVAFLLGNAASLLFNLRTLSRNNALVEQNWTAVSDISRLKYQLVDAQAGIRGYLLSGDPSNLEAYKNLKRQYPVALASFAALAAESPQQRDNVTTLQPLLEQELGAMDRQVESYQGERLNAAVEPGNSRRLRPIDTRLSPLLDTMLQEQTRLLAARRAEASHHLAATMVVGLAINTAAMLALIMFYVLIRQSFQARLAIEDEIQRSYGKLESMVTERTRQLSTLSRHLIQLSEDEKAALAHELHDELGSSLTAINLDMAGVAEKLKTTEPQLATRLNRAMQTLKSLVEMKRRIIDGLRPSTLDTLGLAVAIRAHCDEFTRRTGLPCITEIPDEIGELDPSRSIALYRVAQEALANIAKHAGAGKVSVALRQEPGGISLDIMDEGAGIASDIMQIEGAHGIIGMRERLSQFGGSLKVGPAPAGRGTAVYAFIPFPDPASSTLSASAGESAAA